MERPPRTRLPNCPRWTAWAPPAPRRQRAMGKTPRHFASNRTLDGTYELESLPEFHRVIVTPTLAAHKPSDTAHRDVGPVSANLVKALQLREQYVYRRTTHQNEDEKLMQFDEEARRNPFTRRSAAAPSPEAARYTFSIGASGVAEVKRNGTKVRDWAPPSLADFSTDLVWLYKDVCCGKAECTLAYKRNKMLDKNFQYCQEMNWSYEAEEIRFSRADFRHVVKVDTHIHAASAFTRCELLDFMHAKLQDPAESSRIVATVVRTQKASFSRHFLLWKSIICHDKLGTSTRKTKP